VVFRLPHPGPNRLGKPRMTHNISGHPVRSGARPYLLWRRGASAPLGSLGIPDSRFPISFAPAAPTMIRST